MYEAAVLAYDMDMNKRHFRRQCVCL